MDKIRAAVLVDLGCIVCRETLGVYSVPEIHHLQGINYRATGKKASDAHSIGLCAQHHRTGGHGVAVHAGVKTWEEIYGTQSDFLALTDTLINK